MNVPLPVDDPGRARVITASGARAADDTFRVLFEHNPTPSFVVDEETLAFLAVNAAAERLYGYAPDEWRRLTLRDLRPDADGEDRAALAPGDGERARSPERTRHHRKDGVAFHVEAEAVPVVFTGRRARLVSVRDVSDRVAADNALRASNASLRTLIEQSPYSIQVLSLDGHVTFGNKAWERLFGVTVADIADYNILEDPQLDALGLAADLRRAFEGEAVVLPPTVYRPDRGARRGEDLSTQATMYPVLDHEGRVQHVVLMHEDVTERVLAERARDAERARLDAVIRQMPGAVLIAEAPSGRVVLANEQLSRIAGRAPAVGEPLDATSGWRWLHVDGRPMEPREWPLARALDTGESVREDELLLERPDGTRRVVRASAAPVRDGAGAVVAAVMTFNDATGEVETRRELARRRELYRTLLDAQSDLGEGVCVIENGRFQYVNDAYCALVGYTRDELLALPLASDLLASGEREAVIARRASTKVAPDHFETALVHKNGTRIAVEVAVKALAPAENLGRAVGIVRDVTERKRAEAHIAELRAGLAHAERLAALGSLVSGVAHEVRTPLTYMSNSASLLALRLERLRKGEPIDVPSTVGIAHRILEGIGRVNALVEDLRRFTKLSAREEREPAALDALAADALHLFRATHRDGVAVRADLAPCPPVPADAAQVQQVVLNLLQNAVEASRGTGRAVRLATEPAPDGAWLVVADEGAGMSEDVRARMFDPLFTTKPDGTGLGLSIVKRIVDAHGGEIACESEPARGTTFRVRFPAAPPANP